ncbi:hypothetical protein [Mesorhizobium sp. B2-1-3A]|uniref:hypothetical protein n=1 Tax=Mesorhizobium sp. B2-1-3A TaxID=2589971 RepID=UPI00112E07D0|nr:hypothetical protein [Mesorhizobium sp. B2-1-3A]TPM92732.1 hypothetical protein FJ977_28030 [Mesorhizobium sp. B2-1-3A]
MAGFADIIGMQTAKWLLQDNREFSGMGSGQILQADLGPQLWTASIMLRAWRATEARRIEALLNAVIRSAGSFYLYDPRKAVPARDPRGVILGASAVQINSLPDSKSMSLKGLPAGYRLTAGDYLAFDYGDPARRAFHELAEDATASGGGITPAFEVNPFIRPGAVVNAAVTLIRPAMKCIIKPGSMDTGNSGSLSQISFAVIQKL